MAENLEFLFQGFSKLTREERLSRLKQMSHLSDTDLDTLEGKRGFDLELAEHFIENLVGYFPLPLGIAAYFRIDGRDIPIPMAIEESSVVAAASSTAKWLRGQDAELRTESIGRFIIGQVQFPSLESSSSVIKVLVAKREEILTLANSACMGLVQRGGGIKDISFRSLERPDGKDMLVMHLFCDPCDAMGANLINQACETLKPSLEAWTGQRVGLCILSNLVDSKLTRATVTIPGVAETIGRGIEEASLFAELDPYRATTHNKGVLNGIDPIVIATGNDWRAVEAGVHAYAARSGSYQPVSTWRYSNGTLTGSLEAPLVVGTVGGVTKLHPTAQVCMRILGVKHAEELSRILAAVGLVQNLGALKALSTVGIVKGHMSLHAANLAIAAGADEREIPQLRELLVSVIGKEKTITLSRAKEILHKLRHFGRDEAAENEHA